ncbi:MAG: hypothetical protein MUO80_03715 [Dehalococcoidia bacterium]|nr:hypothetical protein [Dehalococcoidia bacterium]
MIKKAESTVDRFQKMIDAADAPVLIRMRARLEVELAERGVSYNVGEMGEKLCISHFNSTPGLPKLILAPPGAKNVDALSRDGDRYSIKTFMRAKKTGTVYPDKDDKKQLFEYLIIVRLSNLYELKSIHRFSWDRFAEIRAWDRRMNAWYVPLSQRNLRLAELVFQDRSE